MQQKKTYQKPELVSRQSLQQTTAGGASVVDT